MGGIPTMLLMIAAAGVTYGWQPDTRGDRDGDVEYIIQVSPAELARMQRSQASGSSSEATQISSVIDPQVRGHVSRVVLRVGTGDVPRTTPAQLSTERVATLKPDPQGGGGFGLPPSLQNTANDAVSTANQFGNQAIDRAGRLIQNGANPNNADQTGQQANNLLDRLRGRTREAGGGLVQPPSTRPTTSPRTTPAMLGQTAASNAFAQPRVGGPSTDPIGQTQANARDNQWSRFAAQQQQDSRSSESSLASNGLRPSDTFGQMPNALANRNSQATENNNSAARDGIYSQIDQTQRDYQYGLSNNPAADRSAADRSAASVQSTRSGYQQPRSTFANDYRGTERPNPKLSQAQLAAGGWDFDAYDRLIDRQGKLVRDDLSQPNFADRTGNQFSAATDTRQPSQLGAPTLGDPRGTFAGRDQNQMPTAGSASTQDLDRWGQPLRNPNDRYGRDPNTLATSAAANTMNPQLDRRGIDASGNGYLTANDPNRGTRYQDPSYVNSNAQYSNPNQYSNRDNVDSGYDQRYASRSADDYSASAGRSQSPSLAIQPPAVRRVDESGGYSADSPSDRLAQAGVAGLGGTTRPKQVAAQPLFNGLLLISIVANLYLIFWLKNLRVQFKDMVAAKRLASSSASVA